MRAVIQDQYGTPRDLRVAEVPAPVPAAGEVLVRVRATSVHPDVWHVVVGYPAVLRLMGAGVRRPRNPIPGTDLAGTVEAVGADVRDLAPGDEVFGQSLGSTEWSNGATFAELAVARADRLVRTPAGVTAEQAAAVPTSGLIALRCLRDEGRLRPGGRLLVNGAGGGVGSIAVQLGVAIDAHVTAVDRPDKLEMLRSLGAAEVIDYTAEDFTQRPERYDVILDIPGNRTLAEYRRVLTPSGRYVLVGHDDFGRRGHRWLGSLPKALGQVAISPVRRELAGITRPEPIEESLALLQRLLASGQLTPVIGHTFPLEQVAEALELLASGQAAGRILLTP
jgi:NADPH:quinone reductase-like Zn-dependent oxidoreductase